MTRRHFLTIPAAALPASAAPQTGYPGTAYRNYSRCLPDYLRMLAARAYELRNRELAKITTAEAARARQRWARETFWKLVGGMPERTPLNARTTGGFERRRYRVRKIVYESRPNFHIPANLYIPTEGQPPFPGILFQMGHSANGKAYANYQRCCQGLVQLGFLVLAFDPIGQGERVYYPDASGTRTRLPSSDEEHTVPGKQMLLVGDTSSRLQVWDAMRSLDYLAAHPLVDPKRLASTGQSGGGTLTMMLACVDDRLAAAAEISGNTENVACANFNPPGSTDDAEQDFLNSGPLGFDRWDLLYPIAPKPLLVAVSDKDAFGTYSPNYISNGWEEFQKLKKVYELFERPQHLAWKASPLPHGIEYDLRMAVYNWFSRWLKNEERPLRQEPPTEPEPDKTLWVCDSGNVVKSFGGETPFTLNKNRATPKRAMPLEKLLGIDRPTPGSRFTVLGRVPSRGGVEIEAVEVASGPRIRVPAWLYLPAVKDSSKPIILAIEPSGRNARWQEGALWHTLASKGYTVCAADVRGIGDLAPEFGRSHPGHARSHNSEEDYAWASMIFGRPLLGQRVSDLLALAAALKAYPGMERRRLRLHARGALTAPATFAAALDRRIDLLYLAGPLVSYRALLEVEEYFQPFGNFAPNLLLATDLPAAIASLAPRKVIVAGAVDGAGHTLEADSVRQIYREAGNAQVSAQSGWDEAAMLAE